MGGTRGHRPGLGPVFAYEWLTASRRPQGFALRALFVLMLLGALGLVWVGRTDVRERVTYKALAEVGQQFFLAVIGTQITLVLLAAPAATAGAICLDRARGTLAHLMVTDLSDGEIVLGKLAARLVPGQHAVLSTHINADGDGCGSQVAMARLLAQLGLRCTIVNPTPWPEMFRFLLGDDVAEASARGAAARPTPAAAWKRSARPTRPPPARPAPA